MVELMPTPRALVRRPGPRLAEGIVTHIDRQPIDPELALAQWISYVEALGAAGWEVTLAERGGEISVGDRITGNVTVEYTPGISRLVPAAARILW